MTTSAPPRAARSWHWSAQAAEPHSLTQLSGRRKTARFLFTLMSPYHVIKGCTSIKVTQKADFAKPAPVLRSDSTNDLALLKLSQSDLSGDVATLRQGPAVRPGEGVAIYGFPLVGALSLTGNIVSGNVTSLSGLSDDVRYLQISAPVQPGNSGGPLLDESGLVIGVVTSRINDLAVAQTTGAIPQNVNFAIKGSVASSFLEVHSIPLETAPKGAAKALPDIGDAGKASGLNQCQGMARSYAIREEVADAMWYYVCCMIAHGSDCYEKHK